MEGNKMSLLSFLLLLVVGLLVALFLERILSRARRRTIATESGGDGSGAIRGRLADGNACLERIARERDRKGDRNLDRAAEDRIVWRELIELELQDLDEEVNRIREAAGLAAGTRPGVPGIQAGGRQRERPWHPWCDRFS